MRAIVLKKLGGTGVLQVSDVQKPSLDKPNDVLIRMRFSGINYAEILSRKGLYKWVPRKKGYILGMEGSGIVEEVGEAVTNYKIGDPVIVARGFGCHAEYMSLDEKFVFHAIPSFSFEQNAAFTGSFLTAYIALVKMARVKSGQTILIQAAAGALGTATILLAKAMGLKISGTTSNPRKLALLEKMKIDLAINYSEENFREHVMEWTNNRGVDVVIESVGGRVFEESMQCLSPMGRLILVGISSVRFNKFNPFTWWPTFKLIPRVNLLTMLGKSQGILAFHVGRLLDNNYLEVKRIFLELVDFIQHHDIFPIIGKIFPLEEVAEAHRFIETRESFGKILLEID